MSARQHKLNMLTHKSVCRATFALSERSAGSQYACGRVHARRHCVPSISCSTFVHDTACINGIPAKLQAVDACGGGIV